MLEVEEFEDAPEVADDNDNENTNDDNFVPGNILKNIDIPDNKSDAAPTPTPAPPPVNPEQQKLEV